MKKQTLAITACQFFFSVHSCCSNVIFKPSDMTRHELDVFHYSRQIVQKCYKKHCCDLSTTEKKQLFCFPGISSFSGFTENISCIIISWFFLFCFLFKAKWKGQWSNLRSYFLCCIRIQPICNIHIIRFNLNWLMCVPQHSWCCGVSDWTCCYSTCPVELCLLSIPKAMSGCVLLSEFPLFALNGNNPQRDSVQTNNILLEWAN